MYFQKHNFKLLLISLIFVLITSNFAQSTSDITITDLSLTVDNFVVEYMNYQNPQLVKLKFYVNSLEEINSINLNMSELTQYPAKKYEYQSVDFYDLCEKNYQNETDENNVTTQTFIGYYCEKSTVQLLPANTSINISFNITRGEEIILLNETITLKLDNTSPESKEFGFPYCNEERCYISSGLNKITLKISDTIGSFHQKKVFYKVGNNEVRRFYNCTNSECVDPYYYSQCSKGEYLYFSLATLGGIPSSDDAGNTFKNDSKIGVYCDAEPPTFTQNEISYTYMSPISGPEGMPLKQGDLITFTVNVSDDASGISSENIEGIFEELTGDNNTINPNCEKTSFGASCDFLITAVNAGDFNVYFIAKDNLNHSMTDYVPYRIHIDKFDSNASIKTPKFFKDISTVSMAPSGYNRVAIGLMMDNGLEMPLYQKFKMTKATSDVVKIVGYNPIDTRYCYIDYLNGSTSIADNFKIQIADTTLDWKDENRLNLILQWTNVNKYPDNFKLVCNASAYVRTNENTYYLNPTEYQIIIPVKFRNSYLGDQAPGEKLAEAIQNQEDYIVDWMSWLDQVEVWMYSLQGMCDLRKAYTGAAAMFTTVEFTGAGLAKNPQTQPMAQVMVEGAAKPETTIKKTLATSVGEKIDTACKYVTCNIKDQEGDNWWTNGNSDLGNLMEGSDSSFGKAVNAELFSGISRPDVKESIISAVYMKCIPAMIYHANKYRQVQCQKLLCYKQNSRGGMDLSVCDQAESQYICEAIVGEMFDIPGVREVKNLMDNANTLAQTLVPKTLNYLLNSTLCKVPLNSYGTGQALDSKFLEFTIVALCRVPHSIGEVLGSVYRSTKTTESFSYPVQEDICDLALCNEDDVNNCESSLPDWLVQSQNRISMINLNFEMSTTTFNAGQVKSLMKDAQKSGDAGQTARDTLGRLGYDSEKMDGTDRINYLENEISGIDNSIKDGTITESSPVAPNSNGDTTYHFSSVGDYYSSTRTMNTLGKDDTFNSIVEINADGTVKPRSDLTDPAHQTEAQRAANEFNTAFNNQGTAMLNYQTQLNNRITYLENRGTLTPEQKNELNQLKKDKDAFNSNPNTHLETKADQNKKNQQAAHTRNTIFKVTDKLAQFAYTQGWLNWADSSQFGHHTFMGQLTDFTGTYFNSENYKDSLCSAFYDYDADSGSLQGTEVQCTNGLCRAVLTMAAEKMRINETSYLYTLTYFVGNVEKPAGISEDETIEYNVFLKKSGSQTPWFSANWIELQYGNLNNHEYANTRIINDGSYNQICIKFKYPYPPREITANEEFCRDIKDATSGNFDYDTGSFNVIYTPDYDDGSSTTENDMFEMSEI